MPDGLVSIQEQFKGLDISSLIAAPLTAACDAQVMLARSSSDFITQVGFLPDKDDKTKPGEARMVSFSWFQPTQVVGDDGKVTVTDEKMSLQVPLLAIVNIPNLAITDVDISFTMEVKSASEDKSSEDYKAGIDLTAEYSAGPFKVSAKVNASIAAHKESTRSSDNSAKYSVNIKAQQMPASEGLMRVLDIMAKSVVPKTVAAPEPVK